MSDLAASELRRVVARGTPRQIGRALGDAGRAAAHDILRQAPYWRAVTDPAHADAVRIMATTLEAHLPAVWEELQGLADGLFLPLEQVVAWNCRGDLMSNVPDGCTTVLIPGPQPVIAHNEDGLPALRGHTMLAEVTPDDGPSFLSFCYPGSIPGHTFASTGAGLVQAVNNLRLRDVSACLPRMGIGRAVLRAETLDDALMVMERHNASGGFHMSLAQTGDPRLLSVEFGAGDYVAVPVEAPAVHANHALHLGQAASGQTVTASSRDRQARGTCMLRDGVRDPLTILRDTGGPGLPVHRCEADDPDHENTLATAVFRVGPLAVEWSIHDQISEHPVFTSG